MRLLILLLLLVLLLAVGLAWPVLLPLLPPSWGGSGPLQLAGALLRAEAPGLPRGLALVAAVLAWLVLAWAALRLGLRLAREIRELAD